MRLAYSTVFVFVPIPMFPSHVSPHVFFFMVVLLVSALIAWLVWENVALTVERIEVPVEALSPEFDGFRIAQVSDLHGQRFDPAGREAQVIMNAGVDLIAVTGDFVHGNHIVGLRRILPFMRKLVSIAPVYAVSGNHDHWTNWPYIAAGLKGVGVTVLENSHVRIKRGTQEIVLAGVSCPHSRHGSLAQALPLQTVVPVVPVVLLVHAATWFEPWHRVKAPAEIKQVALTLAGHTHGGQVKLPFLGAVTTASGHLFPPKKYVEGLSRQGNGWLYINRGLGQGGRAFRFLSRREITIITLRRTSAPVGST
ncbi:MAG: 3',5'-cyclic adenosine monophosphate phosphodiesterase CpdA [Firmicutes bacterium]|nr:3',5'-cyclic adenosine monophosphate phosphodiesterase CpdA [candidate division NPL-UPA2 bacterium]